MGRGRWEEMTSAVKSAFTPKPTKDPKEKESTVDQIKRDKGATEKGLKEAGAE